MSAYEKLTPKQKEFFDLYVNTRTIYSLAKTFNVLEREARRVYGSKGFQEALAEHNDQLKDVTMYNEAVIIDKLWNEYGDSETPKNVKVNILVMLGKHIGMWANTTKKEETKNSYTYNVINYANVKDEIEKNKEEVDKAKDEPDFDGIDGVEIIDYSGHA
jgi:hypothetical protein